MPSPRHSRPLVAAFVAATALCATTGCTDLDEANAAGVTGDDLISSVSAQLADGARISYTATYQLTGGVVATITRGQAPARTSIAWPGGRLIVTPTATLHCKGAGCVRTPADRAATGGALAGTTLITPEAALEKLNAAALDERVTLDQHDTTVAGRHATCLDLRWVGASARDFSVCVTNEGALAGYSSTVGGERFDQALTGYVDAVDPAAFTLPGDAKITTKQQ